MGKQYRSEGEVDFDLVSRFDDLPEIDQFLDEEEDDTDDDMNRVNNPECFGHIIASVPADETGRWMLVSFGLRGHDIGRKDMWLSRLSLQQIKESVWTLWQDETPQFSVITTYFVCLQPTVFQHAVVVLVEIETDSDTNLLRPVLSVDLNRDGTLIRRPKAVYTPLYSTFEQLHQMHLDHFLCSPQGFRTCTLSLRDVEIQPGHTILVVAGSVNSMSLASCPIQFELAEAWFPLCEICACHIARRCLVDQADDFSAWLYIPDQQVVNLPFRFNDVAQPDGLRGKVRSATMIDDFQLLYFDDDILVQQIRTFNFAVWDRQYLLPPLLVVIDENNLGARSTMHITAVISVGLYDVAALLRKAEDQLHLTHMNRACYQKGSPISFHNLDHRHIVFFRTVVGDHDLADVELTD